MTLLPPLAPWRLPPRRHVERCPHQGSSTINVDSIPELDWNAAALFLVEDFDCFLFPMLKPRLRSRVESIVVRDLRFDSLQTTPEARHRRTDSGFLDG
jgi:hypothetical protein